MTQAIQLDPETEALIASEIAAGHANNAAEFVRRAVWSLVDDLQLEGFRLSLERSRHSGFVGTGDEVLDRIEASICSPR